MSLVVSDNCKDCRGATAAGAPAGIDLSHTARLEGELTPAPRRNAEASCAVLVSIALSAHGRPLALIPFIAGGRWRASVRRPRWHRTRTAPSDRFTTAAVARADMPTITRSASASLVERDAGAGQLDADQRDL